MRGSLPRAVAPAVLLAVCAAAFVGIIAVGLGAPGRTDLLDLYAGARLVATGQGDRLGDQDAVFAEERPPLPTACVRCRTRTCRRSGARTPSRTTASSRTSRC